MGGRSYSNSISQAMFFYFALNCRYNRVLVVDLCAPFDCARAIKKTAKKGRGAERILQGGYESISQKVEEVRGSKRTKKFPLIILHFIVAHYDNRSVIILILITREHGIKHSGTASTLPNNQTTANNRGASNERQEERAEVEKETFEPRDSQKMANNGNVRN